MLISLDRKRWNKEAAAPTTNFQIYSEKLYDDFLSFPQIDPANQHQAELVASRSRNPLITQIILCFRQISTTLVWMNGS